MVIFGNLSVTTVRGQKIGFNNCECIKYLNIANIHALHVWGKRIFICSNKIFFLCLFSVYSFCNATFFHTGDVIKPLQPSSVIDGATPFTGNPVKLLYSSMENTLIQHAFPKFHPEEKNRSSTKSLQPQMKQKNPRSAFSKKVANLFSPKKQTVSQKRQKMPVSSLTAYTHNTCITKHKIDIKTRQKHRYNTIPLLGSIFFPHNYTVAHLFLINNIDHF